MRNTTRETKGETRSAPQFPIQDRLLTDKEMAAYYHVSRATIWRWAGLGYIPAPIKIAGSTRWRGADVVAR